jgi:hypothetical protein
MFMCVVLTVFSLMFFCASMFFAVKYTKTYHGDTGFMAFVCGVVCLALLIWAGSSVGLQLDK